MIGRGIIVRILIPAILTIPSLSLATQEGTPLADEYPAVPRADA